MTAKLHTLSTRSDCLNAMGAAIEPKIGIRLCCDDDIGSTQR